MNDIVNHPSHYTNGSVECWDVVKYMTYGLGNAVKYMWRYEHKAKPVEDLNKSIWYIEHAKERPVPQVHPDVIEPLHQYLADNSDTDDPIVSAVQALVMAEGYEAYDLAITLIKERIEQL